MLLWLLIKKNKKKVFSYDKNKLELSLNYLPKQIKDKTDEDLLL